MRRLLGALACAAALSVAAPAQADTLPPAAFRDRLAAAVTASVHHPAVPVDERTFKTTGLDGAELTVNIDNAYALYLANPTDLDAVLIRYASTLAQTSKAGSEPIDQRTADGLPDAQSTTWGADRKLRPAASNGG